MINTVSSYQNNKVCLLTIIVNRGKSKKVLHSAKKIGITRANVILGEGMAGNHILKILAMNETAKEVLLFIIREEREINILNYFTNEFHFDKPNTGIAFTMPIIPPILDQPQKYTKQTAYVNVITIIKESLAEEFVDFVQSNDYIGGTICKAKGTANIFNPLLQTKAQSTKALIMMITAYDKLDKLMDLIVEKYNIHEENTGIVAVLPVNQASGLPNIEIESPTNVLMKGQMLTAIVPAGQSEEFIQKTKKLGATGGTILHSRFCNLVEKTGLFSFCVDTEEEILMTIVNEDIAESIQKITLNLVFKNQIENPHAFAIPILQANGIRINNE